MAIGNPGVSIKYINNGKTIFETIGDSNLYNAIRMIYGKDTSEHLIKIDYQSSYYKIDGYIANNNVYRSNRNNQLIFINGRYVKSPNIMNAINSAYKDIIPINKYPVYFINLEIDPGKIDVNIHPSKLEVKFDNEGPILEDLGDYVRGTLLKNSLIGRYRSKDRPTKTYESNETFRSFDSFSYSKNEQKENSDLVRENGKSAFIREDDSGKSGHIDCENSIQPDKGLARADQVVSLEDLKSLEDLGLDRQGQDSKNSSLKSLDQGSSDLDNKQSDLKASEYGHILNKNQDLQLSFMEGATSARPEF